MPTYTCPTCRKMLDEEGREDASYRPFCSERCQLIDLYHWFQGDYRIGAPLDPDTGIAHPIDSEAAD
ncbi:MAG: DNA gyrase inhibitor YacG, partial [Planctomycetota bacterium]